MLLKHVNTWSEFWHQQIVTNLDLQSQVSTTRGRKAFTRHGFHCTGVMFLRHFKFHRTLQISGPALVQHLANKISICCIRSVGWGVYEAKGKKPPEPNHNCVVPTQIRRAKRSGNGGDYRTRAERRGRRICEHRSTARSEAGATMRALFSFTSAERSDAETVANILHERSGDGDEFANIVRPSAAKQGRPCVRCSASYPPSEARRKRW